MSREFVPLAIRIKETTKKLQTVGFSVINTNDETFAILAERKRSVCRNHHEFFRTAATLTECLEKERD